MYHKELKIVTINILRLSNLPLPHDKRALDTEFESWLAKLYHTAPMS